MLGRESNVELAESAVAQQRGMECSGGFIELRSSVEDECLVGGFIVARRSEPGRVRHGGQNRGPVRELHDVGDVINVLIESGEVVDTILLYRPADHKSEL